MQSAKVRKPRNATRTRMKILAAAQQAFSDLGYAQAGIREIAAIAEVNSALLLRYYGSKAGLFFEAYKRAVSSLPAWLDAPRDVLDEGFFATVMYWLTRTEHLVREDLVPYRVSLIGNYGTDLSLKRDINRFLVSEDPYGTLEFVEFGIGRGEVRDDIDLELVVSIVDWLSAALQEALVTEELDPGLFHRWRQQPERQRARVEQFAEVLRSAIGRPATKT